jgi:predicted transcriptional regulator
MTLAVILTLNNNPKGRDGLIRKLQRELEKKLAKGVKDLEDQVMDILGKIEITVYDSSDLLAEANVKITGTFFFF